MEARRFMGVMPPMITPFTESGAVNYKAFVSNLERWNQTELFGYLVNGSNSETAYLSENEKIELVKLTVEHAAAGRQIIAGTGIESLTETIRFTNKCAEVGAAYALVLTPFYYSEKMNSVSLIDYFTRLAENSFIPIMIYNVPKFTHVNIKPDAVASLSIHPNIVGMKDSMGDVPQLAAFKRASAGQDFEILVGTAAAWFPALTMDVSAGILALANCYPKACSEVKSAFETGDYELSRDIYHALCPANTAVTATYGIAGLKYACELKGFHGGYVRCPLQPLSNGDCDAIKQIIFDTDTRLAAFGL